MVANGSDVPACEQCEVQNVISNIHTSACEYQLIRQVIHYSPVLTEHVYHYTGTPTSPHLSLPSSPSPSFTGLQYMSNRNHLSNLVLCSFTALSRASSDSCRDGKMLLHINCIMMII